RGDRAVRGDEITDDGTRVARAQVGRGAQVPGGVGHGAGLAPRRVREERTRRDGLFRCPSPLVLARPGAMAVAAGHLGLVVRRPHLATAAAAELSPGSRTVAQLLHLM